ncbi:hypothetical protein PMIN02_001694 [Paraphaeosphaeria minitans]
MGWQDRIVYFRDFAYAHPPRRTRMASGTVGDVPAATYAELLSGRMIDIYVGEARRHWALHRSLLCHHSELLESELQGHGKQRKDSLDLPDHDPAGFELLVKWLYQGKLDDVSDMPDAEQKYDYAVSCHKLYLLCDRFDMPQLKNVAMDQYRKGLNQAELVPDAEEIDDIYRKSPKDSPFRRLMTRIAARQIMDPDSDRDVETYRQCFENNTDFAIELVKAMKYGTGGMLFDNPTNTGNECEYHDHDDGPNCHVKGKGKQVNHPPPRPQIRQLRSFDKVRPDSPPTPPASSPADSAGPASPTRSPPERDDQRGPSTPPPHKSGFFDSRDVNGARNGGSAEPQGAKGQVPESHTPRETPSHPSAHRGDSVTPSPRRPPPKLRRRVSPTPG